MSTPQPRRRQLDGVSGRVRLARPALTGCLVRAPAVVVGATQCGVCCLSFIERFVARSVGETGGGGIKLAASSGRSRVLGNDAVGLATRRFRR
jgi:hypothetical protein